MTTHSLKDMMGHDVVAVDTAESIGKVKHVVVSPMADRIERLHIDGRKKNAIFSEWDDLESFGADRVMVTKAGTVGESEDDRDLGAAKGDIDILGARILDTAGFEHGVVSDVAFDADSGAIVSIQSSDGAVIDSADVHSLGTYALMVDPLT